MNKEHELIANEQSLFYWKEEIYKASRQLAFNQRAVKKITNRIKELKKIE